MQDTSNNERLSRLESWLTGHVDQLAFCIVAIGFFMYVYYGIGYYLNPDEASHFVMANRKTVWQAYAASHSLAHPPLMIIALHFLLGFGNSVFLLRFLSAALCAAAAWSAFKWVQLAFGSVEAIIALIFLAFSPGMISIACEVRQYAMLLFFICGALYFLQRFLEERSLWAGIVYTVLLYGAILTHYSAIWIAIALSIYSAIVFLRKKPGRSLAALWAASQFGIVALYGLLYITHVRWMRNSGFADAQIYGFLKGEYFFSDKETIISFISRSSLDVFSYLAGGKLAGIIVLCCFLLGIVTVTAKSCSIHSLKSKRHDSFLLILPFIIGCIGAIIRVLPFGGSRHISYLLPFAAAGIALCLVRVFSVKRLSLSLAAGIILVPIWLTGWYPSNAAPSMSDVHMKAALAQLNEKVPADAILFVDDATHYVLAYYLAHDHFQGWGHKDRMGKYRVVWAKPFSFSPTNFEQELVTMSRSLDIKAGEYVYVMTVGWSGADAFNVFLSGYPPERIKEHLTFGPITLLQVSAPARIEK